MNYTPLDDAYKVHHIASNTYGGNVLYNPTCIYCKNPSSKSLMNGDGGSFRQCYRCRKQFTATIIGNAIQNFSHSTHHLKGTN
jgi:hypothetical protein